MKHTDPFSNHYQQSIVNDTTSLGLKSTGVWKLRSVLMMGRRPPLIYCIDKRMFVKNFWTIAALL